MSEPVLSAEEWQDAKRSPVGAMRWYFSDHWGHYEHADESQMPAIIALANHALPDSDPAKITRETIALLRNAGAEANQLNDPYETDPVSPYAKDLRALADALERYLPPP